MLYFTKLRKHLYLRNEAVVKFRIACPSIRLRDVKLCGSRQTKQTFQLTCPDNTTDSGESGNYNEMLIANFSYNASRKSL